MTWLQSASEMPAADVELLASTPTIFRPAVDSSREQLFQTGWRAHLGVEMPSGTIPHVSIKDAIYAALDDRDPLAGTLEHCNWILIDFSVEDDQPRSWKLLRDVGEFVVGIVEGSSVVVAEIECHDAPLMSTQHLQIVRSSG